MRQVAFLRSINVGGRRVRNETLEALFVSAGLRDVSAYQAAGNVVFSGDFTLSGLEATLREGLGYDVPIVLRSLQEVRAIGVAAPFAAEVVEQSTGKLQVLLLAEEPTEAAAASAQAQSTDHDRLRLVGRELYWLPVAGVSGTELDTKSLERLLGLQTCRTQGTLQRLAKKFG